MDLRTMECFVAVVEEGTITRAAARLHMSQPPLTVRLKSLESELGVELLSRHGRGVEPTAAGRVFAERARRLLVDAQSTADAVRSVGHGVSGHLSLTVGSSVAPSLLATLVRVLRDQAPEVSLSVADGNDAAVSDRVAHGEADAGLLHLAPREAGAARHSRALETAVATREPLMAVLREDHPGATAERADPATTTLALVQAGLGVTIMPVALAEVAWRGLRAMPLRQHHPAVETAVVWRHDATSPVLRRFLPIALATPEPDVLGPDQI